MGEVIQLGKKREEKKPEEAPKSKEELDSEQYFKDIEAANKAKAEKLKKEKAQANKSVLRSYRIKDT